MRGLLGCAILRRTRYHAPMLRDPELETLMLPFADGALPWPGEAPVLFLQARDGWPLHQRRMPGLVCEQVYKPAADALERSGSCSARCRPRSASARCWCCRRASATRRARCWRVPRGMRATAGA